MPIAFFMRWIIIPLFIFSTTVPLLAQEQDPPQPEEQKFSIDTPANLDFTKEEEPVNTEKKKKVKKKVFYGLKTKKGFTRKGQESG